MFEMSPCTSLPRLDMKAKRWTLRAVPIAFALLLVESRAFASPLPYYRGWYLASPIPTQFKYYSPPIRKLPPDESVDIYSYGPVCLDVPKEYIDPRVIPYPYEIFHVAKVIRPHESLEDESSFEDDSFEDDKDVAHTFYLAQEPDEEDYYMESQTHSGTESETEPTTTTAPSTIYYTLGSTTEHPAVHPHATAAVTAAPSNTEQPIFYPDPPFVDSDSDYRDSTEYPMESQENKSKEVAMTSASHVSANQQALLQSWAQKEKELQEEEDEEEERSPCDGYFEKYASTLSFLLQRYIDGHKDGKTEGLDDADDESRSFIPKLTDALKDLAKILYLDPQHKLPAVKVSDSKSRPASSEFEVDSSMSGNSVEEDVTVRPETTALQLSSKEEKQNFNNFRVT